MISKGMHNMALKMVKNHPELRLGQAVMNVLRKYYPDIYNKITDTECDCFYLDERVNMCLSRVDIELKQLLMGSANANS